MSVDMVSMAVSVSPCPRRNQDKTTHKFEGYIVFALPTTKNYLASNINSDDSEKLCPTLNKRKSKLSSEQTRAFISTFPASLHSAALYLK